MPDSDLHRTARKSVTAIVCTYNRCRVLPSTLEDLAASQLPDSVAWEVIVVDNNSADQTREVVERFCQRYPGIFRYIWEPRSGKSHALNTGINRSQGEILAFVDDDVKVPSTWLQNLTGSLHSGEWAGAGGRILPAETFTVPDWFSVQDFGALLFGRFDFGDDPCELVQAPYGANMAFRKEMFTKYGGFRTDLGPGPNPGIPRPNEDTEFGRRLMAAGEKLRYEPQAVLYHPVDLVKLNQQFLLAWHFDYGRAFAHEFAARPGSWGIPWRFLSIFKSLVYRLPTETLKWLFNFRKEKRFRNKCRVWRFAGQMTESFRYSHRRDQEELVAAQQTKP